MRKGKLRIRGRAKLCLALGLLAGWAGFVAAQGMAVSGKFEVEPTGAASYTIPIAVPPGTAGMTPSLALSYNSQGRNGMVGVGWSLEGLASVSRCPRTFAQDGVRGSVTYDANDRFCLDGQRLVAISGTYGADGTEYRTEVESFSKIISRGTAGTGPAWFEVWTKAGQRLEFGNTADSRVLAQGKPTARDWMVNKVADTKGNYFTVTYINDTTNGQVYPSRADYTANDAASLAAYNSVRFVYDMGRPDVVPLYHAGSLIKTTVRLTNVQTYAGSTLVADYRLSYQQGPTTGRSQLTSVTLCDGVGTCLPATTFGWQNGSFTPTVVSNAGGQNGTLAGYRPFLGDFNGDGMADVMWDSQKAPNETDPPDTSSGTRVLWTSTGGGGFTVDGNLAGQNGTLVGYAAIVADFNRDGRSDVFWVQMDVSAVSTGPTAKWVSAPSGSYAASSGPWAPAGSGQFISGSSWGKAGLAGVIDFNGDGRSDVLWSHGSNSGTATIWTIQADDSVGSTSVAGCAQWPGWSNCVLSIWAPDFNGDGLSDIFWLDENNLSGRRWALLRNNADGTFSQVDRSNGDALDGYRTDFVDINGDGKTDFFWDNVDSYGRSKGQRILWVSRGDGTFDKQTNVSGQNATLSGYVPHAGDFNGDGLTDILWVQTDSNGLSSGARVLWQGKGDGTFTVVSNFGGQDGTLIGYVPILADFNGDGKTDVLWDHRVSGVFGAGTKRSTGTRVLWLSDGVAADLMTSVTGGTGASAAITYKSLMDNTVYTRDTTSADPVVDLQGAMFVVSRVDASNGIGGTLGTGYAFAGAKLHLDGRGFLGFRQMAVTDLQTNVVHTTDYNQEYPFVGLLASETRKLAGVTLGQTTNVYGWTPLGGTRFSVFLAQSRATATDLDGSALPTATSTYQYDGFGNATEIVVAATDGFQKTTTNTYTNDQANWLLGRLTHASVASVVAQPGPPPQQEPTSIVISSSTNNLNLWNHVMASGLTSPGGSWVVTIASGVTISSTSTAIPALDTGAFPSGSTLKIVNNGTVAGAGGNGGTGGTGTMCDEFGCSTNPTTPGSAGGPALQARSPVVVVNNHRIWGGGGGGGGGRGYNGMSTGGGGGGAGVAGGKGGPGGRPGASGTPTSGGAGGNLWAKGGNGGGPGLGGDPGTCTLEDSCSPLQFAGGSPGSAVLGNSLITWAVVGDRKGPLN